MQYNGTTDSTLSEFWFEQCLLPCLSEDTVIVMDNASFHRKDKLTEIAYRYNQHLIFLPPYSPELNPIEKLWANLKAYIKSNIYSSASIDDLIASFFKV